MPVPTGDPGTMIDILGRFLPNWEEMVLALQTMGVDTTALTEQGITTLEQLKQALANDQITPVFMQSEKLIGFAKVGAVDPANSNAVSTKVITDITTVGGAGTAVSQYTTAGNRTLGLVAKAVAVGACLSLLVSTIGAGLVTDEIKQDLITSADPYTIDGENVPVLIDDNGKTHFPAELIESVRRKALDLGIFSKGSSTVPSASDFSDLRDYFQFPLTLQKSDVQYTGKRGGSDYIWEAHNATGVIHVWNPNTNRSSFIVASTQNNVASLTSGYEVAPTTSFATLDYTYNGKTVYYTYTSTGSVEEVNGSYVPTTYSADLPSEYIARLAWLSVYGSEEGTGVEGITPASDLINAGIADMSKPITQVIPKLLDGEEETATPTDEDLEEKTKWYPVNINSTDVFTDGATEDETGADPEGNVNPDIEPDIYPGLRELIEEILRNPDKPDDPVYPTIPVSDDGDTPPEEPPLISGSANGLWSIYNPTLSQVQDFGAYLWSENILDQITRMFNSPIDAVIGFHMIYCSPIKGPARNIKCGYLDTGVSSITVANQYVTINCGSVTVPEYYGTALDYSYTKLALYLPFIGIVPLSTAVCMGSTLQVIYRIDVLTGTCLAQVKVIKRNSNAVMYAFEGNCSVQIPLTATTYTGTITALINGVSAGLSVFMGDFMSAGQDAAEMVSGLASKSGTKQSGALGSNAGALGIRIPYLIITHPTAYDAYAYSSEYGFPLNQTVSLGSLSGYTRVKDIHLAGIPCTDDELEQIESLLKDGVIIN